MEKLMILNYKAIKTQSIKYKTAKTTMKEKYNTNIKNNSLKYTNKSNSKLIKLLSYMNNNNVTVVM